MYAVTTLFWDFFFLYISTLISYIMYIICTNRSSLSLVMPCIVYTRLLHSVLTSSILAHSLSVLAEFSVPLSLSPFSNLFKSRLSYIIVVVVETYIIIKWDNFYSGQPSSRIMYIIIYACELNSHFLHWVYSNIHAWYSQISSRAGCPIMVVVVETYMR